MSEQNVPLAHAPEGRREGSRPEKPGIVRDKEKTGLVRRAGLAAWVSLLIVWLVWGSTYLAIRVGVETIPPLPTATVATYAYVNPVIAVLLGALILNERLTQAMIGGGVLIVGAVVLVVRRSPPAH